MENLKGKKIIVTGGAGFIGGHLVKRLTELKTKVIVIDIKINPSSIFFQNNHHKKTIVELTDIRNKKRINDIFTKYKPDFVFHLAAKTLVEESYHNPCETLETNILGTINILEACKNNNIQGTIVASSDKAYGKLYKDKYNESDPLKGDHPYDVSKSATDLIANAYFVTYKLPVIITRFGNVYGEGDINFSRIIPSIVKSVIRKKKLLLRSDGKYIRNYLYVKDVVSGYIILINNLNKLAGNAFNFSSAEKLSVLELIKKAENILNIKIPYKILNNSKNEIPYQHLDDSKIRKIGWKNQYKIDNVIKPVIAWYRKIL